MRTALSVAALAAGALAVPYKRDVVYTTWDVVYVTDVVTVTAGQAPAYSSASSSEASVAQHYGHRNGWHPHSSVWTSASATTWTEVASPSSTSTSTPAPAYTPSPSSTPEPETSTSTTPSTSSTSSTSTTPVYQVPLTTFVPVLTSTYVAPKSSAAATTSASAGGYGSADATYGKAVIDSHNLHRSNHSASDIAWDDELYQIAVSIAESCVYAHNTTAGGGGYGQNIAAGVDMNNIDSVITDMFYNGEEWQFADAGLYGEANPDMSNFESWGHFTQLVWKDTTHVACYTTTTDVCPTIYSLDASGNKTPMSSLIPPYFTVCNYKNPGNYAGEYANNVGKPLGQPISYASSSS